MKLKFDESKCTGCCACQMACMDQRDVQGLQQAPLCRMEIRDRGEGIAMQFVHCIQCGKCAKVCPTGCLHLRDGLVLADTEKCVGCHTCETVCPFGVLSFSPETGKVMKCDGCWGRVQAGLLPSCVHTCPTGALHVSY